MERWLVLWVLCEAQVYGWKGRYESSVCISPSVLYRNLLDTSMTAVPHALSTTGTDYMYLDLTSEKSVGNNIPGFS